MKRFPAACLFFASLLHGQGQPTWLSNSRAVPLRGPRPANASPAQPQSYSTPYEAEPYYNIEEDPGYNGVEQYLADPNQYIDPNIFQFTNSGALGEVPLLPAMPPLLTNTNAQDIIDFIKNNMQTMEGPPQPDTDTAPRAKTAEERAFLDGRPEYEIPVAAEGLWWRFYSQNTSIYNIPAAVEEMMVIAPATGEAVWMQTIQTAGTVQSRSQRRLQIAMYIMNTGSRNKSTPLWFFYYPSTVYSANPNPIDAEEESQLKKIQNFPIATAADVANAPAYFVQIFPDQGFMQMSKDPSFPHDRTMFWRRFPREVPNIIAPASKTNEALPQPKAPAEGLDAAFFPENQPALEGDLP